MARPPKWNSPTEAIRVPAHAVDAVMALAKQLDGSYVNDPSPDKTVLVTWGNESYLINDPGNLSPEQNQAIDQAVDEFWHIASESGLDHDDVLYIIGELSSQCGRPINVA